METNIRHDGQLSVVELTGSINSGNAHEFEDALSGEPSSEEGVIFRVVNVNDEVMNVFDVTGFSEIMDISRAVRQLSVEGCDRIGAGACGEVFRLDDETIIKLYYPRVKKEEIEQEKALAKKAFVMGVPTAISYDIVEADGRTGVVYELIKSKTIGELIRGDEGHLEEYVDMYAAVCRQIHGIEAEPGQLPSFKDINRSDIPNVTGITEEERAYLHRFLDLIPDRMNCLHGDLNINNIMVQNGECCLIDMGEFSTGTPMFDLSRILFSMEFAGAAKGEFNSFYKLPQDIVTHILHLFLEKYFGCPLAEAEKTYPDAAWLYPLAWFRCCTSLLKGDRWGEEKRAMALDILRTQLIPFVDAQCGK